MGHDGERAIVGVKAEGVNGAVPTEQDIDRSGAHMWDQLCTLGVGFAAVVQLFQYALPICLFAEEQQEVDLAIVVDGQALHPVHFLLPVMEV